MLKKPVMVFMILIIVIVIFTGCEPNPDDAINEKITVAVSIAPQKTFVREVAGENINVIVLIPPGYSPENHEPTPALLQGLSKASLFFAIGVPAENGIIPRISDINNELDIIHLDEEVGAIYPNRYFEDDNPHGGHGETNTVNHIEKRDAGHSHIGRDPHIWLSPRRVSVMIDVIARELAELDGENAELYKNNASAYKEELAQLDESIKSMFEGVERRKFIMYHPSLGYFADDYGLVMYALEKEGKEPSAKEMQELIDMAVSNDIRAVLYQAEIDSGLTEAFASGIRGKSVRVDPLSEDYIDNLFEIANELCNILKDNGR